MHHGRPDARDGGGCCARCYVEQQRYTYPFGVYCPHLGRLVLVHGRRRYEVWPLTVDELLGLVRRAHAELP